MSICYRCEKANRQSGSPVAHLHGFWEPKFHWQDYDDHGYLTALRHLQDLQREGKISLLGLCNFDSERMDEICKELGPGVIVSNQVQVRKFVLTRRRG